MAAVDGTTGEVLLFGLIKVSMKFGGKDGGGRHKSCKGLSKQMRGGAFVIKCSEDRCKPLVLFFDADESEYTPP